MSGPLLARFAGATRVLDGRPRAYTRVKFIPGKRNSNSGGCVLDNDNVATYEGHQRDAVETFVAQRLTVQAARGCQELELPRSVSSSLQYVPTTGRQARFAQTHYPIPQAI